MRRDGSQESATNIASLSAAGLARGSLGGVGAARGSCIWLMLEYCDHGDLLSWLHDSTGKRPMDGDTRPCLEALERAVLQASQAYGS